MGTLILTLQLLWAVVVAVARGIGRRLRHGAAVPGWDWSVEMTAVALRAFIMSAEAHPDPEARAKLETSFDPPLPRRLRRVMRVVPATVGDVTGEWIERTGAGLDDVCTMLYFHGGAYVAGSPATHRQWVARLSWAIGCRSYVPDYRLAPEHRFPAAIDDAMTAYLGLLDQGIAADQIVLAGDSAGGGLATALLLRLRDEHKPLPAGAVLFSPYTDLEHTGESIIANVATDYLPLGEIRANWEYLGDHDPRDPHASPLHGDFTGIPPLLVMAGGREMILDDALRLATRATADGCDVTLHVAADMYHVWPALLPSHPDTLVAEAKAAAWVTGLIR